MISRSRRGSGFPPRAGPAVSRITLAACLALLPGLARAATPDVSVTNARMRVLIAARPAAGYFTLHNNSNAGLSLVQAAAADCGSLMLHKSTETGGMARMEMVMSVPVPPHGTIRFAPGGYHLMCMQPSGPLLTRTGIETVTLKFAGGESVAVPFKIEGVGQ